MTADQLIGGIGVVIAIAVVLWFFLVHGPADESEVERPDEVPRPPAHRGHTSPAGPDAEEQVPPR